MSRAMFFGRFQPPHKGHMEVARRILEEYDELVFLVGMSGESHTERNPFTAGERIEMLRLSARDMKFDLGRIITATLPTLELHISSAYQALTYAPAVDAAFVGNKIVARMFEELGVKVVVPQPYHRDRFSGAVIRELMRRGDPKWRELVTPSTARFIEEINGPERLRSIAPLEDRHVLEEKKM